MPELPEVETIRSYLDSVLAGKAIMSVPHLDDRMVKRSLKNGAEIRAALVGQTFGSVRRRGKFLLLGLASSPDALMIHLGMSGRLVTESLDAPYRPHTHLVVRYSGGELRLSDPRRFGRIAWVESGGLWGPHLGMEPLSSAFSSKTLGEILKGRKVAIKSALLNQNLVAGLGNIYADEALFYAGIHPQRPAGSLDVDELKRLVRGIRAVLRRSIEHRGTSFSDYVDALGHPGENQGYLKVYGREGKACRRCGTPIQRQVVGGRSSHYCPHCQRLTETSSEGAHHAEI
ncbi:bifunctional DNA-formamidopyrimidine glycosylase/DNA-(apurinic or apyrimidinic site) lyase [Sulfobacillus harzensis]|uniref:Formamidopyrimidine-DNA glycosylase n=1 Tax=Sulfobacillus harzensis TaxID=2729629 RepID=A0A7Y0L523_9FIRM|nr:bifunctional DNA-formamidopyrimidine glycosylase/DNA-(apurinic or apyrimidinic site) lyase [Sulfobacillus harzensis]NMP22841.1 bifunctional DNA-formamidopyrimidine glycosylase/DNA-(apurinic or apyrimidinic site) lyase [Sulfobacillus harzensis]